MQKITRIILWIIGLSFLIYFLFLPIDISREKPSNISPQENLMPVLDEFSTSTENEF